MDTIGYRVGTEIYYNIYLAILASQRTGEDVEFYCRNSVYEQFDWTIEPTESLYELMTSKAHALRSKYERLILFWSGGTDSHTIYNVFKRNNIHIDEIIFKTSKNQAWYSEDLLLWLKNNHWDKHTIITTFDKHDMGHKSVDFPDENWVWKNKGDFGTIAVTDMGESTKALIERNHGGYNWRAIAGFEKTRLVYDNGRWYARQLDNPLRRVMGYDYIEKFFLDPLITIKQSHLYKRAVKAKILRDKLPLYNGDWAEAKYPNTTEGYREKAFALGLDEELRPGISLVEKVCSDDYNKLDIVNSTSYDTITKMYDPVLQELLKTSSKIAHNYLNGLYSLKAQTGFVDYANEKGYLREKDQLANPKLIFSKHYDIGA
jgi:hypothetical protein